MPGDIIHDPNTGHQVAYVDTAVKFGKPTRTRLSPLLLKASSIQHVASFGTSRKFGQGAVLVSTRKLHEAAEDKDVSRYQELRNNPIGNVGHLVQISWPCTYAKSIMPTCSSATQERDHAARRWVLLRCCAVYCGG